MVTLRMETYASPGKDRRIKWNNDWFYIDFSPSLDKKGQKQNRMKAF